jgi:hypothetical protein
MTTLWAWIGLISGSLLGLGVILLGLGTPEQLRAPLGVIGAVCGPVGFAVYQLYRVRKSRLISKRALSIRAVSFGVLAIVVFAAYWMLVTQFTVEESGNSEVFFLCSSSVKARNRSPQKGECGISMKIWDLKG